MRWSAQTEVAVINAGGIRGDKIYPAGTTITRREVLAALPFGNRLVTIDIGGSALRTAIENGLSRLAAPSGRFPQVAGLKIEADPSRFWTTMYFDRRSQHHFLLASVGSAFLDDDLHFLDSHLWICALG